MIKKIILSVVCLAVSVAFAKREVEFNPGFEDTELWQEKREVLPDFPDMNDSSWLSFDAGNALDGTPMVLYSSIYRAEDGSVRYVYNLRSSGGFDNLSVEGIYCKDGTNKAFAFGDTVNHRWIESKGTEWRKIGTALHSTDKARHFLAKIFCLGDFPKNREEMYQKMQETY